MCLFRYIYIYIFVRTDLEVRFLELNNFFPRRLFYGQLFLDGFGIEIKFQKFDFWTKCIFLLTTRPVSVESFEKIQKKNVHDA